MSQRRILVTGATGFIGRYLLQLIHDNGDDVLGTSTSPQTAGSDLVTLDLSNAKHVVDIVSRYSPTHVVHLAGIASVTHEDLLSIYAINVLGTQNLLEAIRLHAPNIEHVMLASTAGVYGNQEIEFLSESLSFNPSNHYSISKASMEMLSHQYIQDYKITIIRPFNIIGVGQNNIFLIPKLTKLFAERAEVIEVGNISSIRDYISVEDCVWVVYRVLVENFDFSILNICSGKGLSGEDVIDILKNITNHYPKIQKSNEFSRRSEVWRLVGSVERMKVVLANKHFIQSMEYTLERMVRNFTVK